MDGSSLRALSPIMVLGLGFIPCAGCGGSSTAPDAPARLWSDIVPVSFNAPELPEARASGMSELFGPPPLSYEDGQGRRPRTSAGSDLNGRRSRSTGQDENGGSVEVPAPTFNGVYDDPTPSTPVPERSLHADLGLARPELHSPQPSIQTPSPPSSPSHHSPDGWQSPHSNWNDPEPAGVRDHSNMVAPTEHFRSNDVGRPDWQAVDATGSGNYDSDDIVRSDAGPETEIEFTDVSEQTQLPWARQVRRTHEMDAVSDRAHSLVKQGFGLAQRGAYFSAQNEFVRALRLISQARDAERSTTVHAQALAAGLRALEEAEDFVPRGMKVEADLDLDPDQA